LIKILINDIIIIGDTMKKFLSLLVVLFIFALFIQWGFNFFGKGSENDYSINDILIHEKFSHNNKNEIDNYYFEIKTKDNLFALQIFDNLNYSTKVIKDIKHFKNNNYECVLPIFSNNKVYTDMICKKDIYYNYNDIKGLDKQLDDYVSSLALYNSEKFNQNDEYKEKSNFKFYSNIIDNHYLSFDLYRGIVLYNNIAFQYIPLFNKDVYNRPISIIVDKYYVVADYNNNYDFNEFYMINLETGSTKKITSNQAISLDSYIQGVVDKKIYLIDKSNKKQYEIDIKTKTAIEIGNENTGIKIYKNYDWTEGNIYEAINNKILFNDYTTSNILNGKTYYRIDKYGNNLSGYYYIYEKVGNEYNVYRANVQNSNYLTYLFKTNNIGHMIYNKDVIYYKDNNQFKYYKDSYGVKKIAESNELRFNNNLNMYLYVK